MFNIGNITMNDKIYKYRTLLYSNYGRLPRLLSEISWNFPIFYRYFLIVGIFNFSVYPYRGLLYIIMLILYRNVIKRVLTIEIETKI